MIDVGQRVLRSLLGIATTNIELTQPILQAIEQTVQAARRAGIRVGLCGELAAEPLAVPILLGLGLDELSLNPQSIPQIKQIISQLTIQQAEAIAHSALQLDSATEIRSFISRFPLFQES